MHRYVCWHETAPSEDDERDELVASRSTDVIFVVHNSLDGGRLSGASYGKLQDWAGGDNGFDPLAVPLSHRPLELFSRTFEVAVDQLRASGIRSLCVGQGASPTPRP